MNELEFKIIKDNKDNKETICYTVATYHDDESNKDFIIYTDNTYNEKKELNIYYSLYKIIDNNIKLMEIKNNNDRKLALELIKEIIKQD